MVSKTPDFEAEFENAQLGRGSAPMSLEDAELFLDFVSDRGWAFQSMEASEINGQREIPDFRFVILGLSRAEKEASSPEDLHLIAKSTLTAAKSTGGEYIFQIWIDKPDRILAHRS
ncbi:MAG: hypothetical protein HLUCCA04_06550 [Oceanicaulis sp. HLUCCA04]|nr:MAG: hypothetical protein HLUCCA04_06550 [Oceanicaulis sp. HLUCCA04]